MDGKTILVVEDNELNMKLIRALLQIGEFRVLEAPNAEIGLQFAREEKPDLILMDIQLPGMDGLTATCILKQDPSTQKIPVVALTSYAMEGDREKARAAGCDDYISKPLDTREFLNRVRKLVPNGHESHLQPFREAAHRKRILIVDDEPMNIKLLEAQIPPDLYEISRAYSGVEGLQKIFQNPPDLVLLDIMMQGMDGYEVTRKLKTDPVSKDIPIILVTALGGIEDKIKGLIAGADEFLNRPVQRVELLARVRSLILFKELQEQYASRSQVEGLDKGGSEDRESGGASSNPQKVWVVEDNALDAKLIHRYLHEFPLELEFIRNGTDALARIQKDSIDLILLDILMPGLDGFEICGQLKKQDRTRNIQILVTSSLSDLQTKAKMFELGADDILIKPINGYELRVRVSNLLRKKTYLDKLQKYL
jgi:two-component system cell cycle response regulator